ncbi:MAG: GNVR domain-containing protein [Syntrophobacteraceae bacterium]
MKPETIFPRLVKGPYQGLSNSDAALVLLEKDISVSAGKKGNVIEVAFTGSDPARAAAVVNQLVNYYIDKRTEIYKDPKSVLFLEKKADEYRQKLVESEDRLKAFREETGIVSFDDQRAMLLKQRSDLVIALSGAANQITEVQERISELGKQLSSIPKTDVTATAHDRTKDAEARLLGLQLQEKDLVSKYKEDNLLVANVRSQIAMVNEFIAKQSADQEKSGAAPPDPVYQDVQKQTLNNRAELSALKVRYTATQKQLGELNTEIQTFEARENRFKELTRDVAANEEKYRNYRHRLEEAKVYDELDRQKMTSVSVIEPAGVPIVPVNPMKPLILLIAAAIGVGIMGSLGIAYVRELSKQVISTAAEAEKRLDLPVLVTIPIKSK